MVHKFRFSKADFRRGNPFRHLPTYKKIEQGPEVNPLEALKPEPSETEKKRQLDASAQNGTKPKKHKKIKIDFGF